MLPLDVGVVSVVLRIITKTEVCLIKKTYKRYLCYFILSTARSENIIENQGSKKLITKEQAKKVIFLLVILNQYSLTKSGNSIFGRPDLEIQDLSSQIWKFNNWQAKSETLTLGMLNIEIQH